MMRVISLKFVFLGRPESVSSRDSYTALFQAPHFTMPLSDVEFGETEELHLKCNVSGAPTPMIRWLYNGEQIIPDDRCLSFFEKKKKKRNENLSGAFCQLY